MPEGQPGPQGQPRSAPHLWVVSAATVISVLAVIFVARDLAHQPVLVTSLASSVFLLYWQPLNEVNRFRPLVLGHVLAACVGYAVSHAFPAPYASAGISISVTVVLLSVLRLVHPPAVSTSLVFAYQPRDASALGVFLLTLVVVVALATAYLLLRRVIHPSRWSHLFHWRET